MPARETVRFVVALIVPVLLSGCGAVKTPPPPPPPAQRFAIVANSSSNNLSTFTVDPQTGNLTPKNTVATGGMNSRIVALAPSGRVAYVANLDSNDISVFTVDPTT